jgi:replicative DNA helicase
MILNPPLRVGSTEITSVNEKLKSLHITVHLTANPEDIATVLVQKELSRQLTLATNYMMKEGFISSDPTMWLTHVGAILHNPNN